MPFVEFEFTALRIPQLAALATSACPAWLWSVDASRILWANAVGAAVFGVGSAAELDKIRFGAKERVTAQIVRLAATLPSAARVRLERLRGFGAALGGPITCACSRIVLPDCRAAVLVAALEPAGPALPLRERVRRIIPDGPIALASFTADGTLLYANAAALPLLGEATTLAALGVEAIAAAALEGGRASGAAGFGDAGIEVTAERVGEADCQVLVLTLPQQPRAAAARNTAPAEPNPVPQPPTPAAVAASSPTIAATAAQPPKQSAFHEPPIAERRYPLRFAWWMDADGRFVVGSDEFIEVVGPRTTTECGRLWSEIAAALKLDPDDRIARAVATRQTWSGILLYWPVDESDQRLPVELSGLPVFDQERGFHGYRGFGVCRDMERVNQLMRARRTRPIGFTPPPPLAPAVDSADDHATTGAAAAAAAPQAAAGSSPVMPAGPMRQPDVDETPDAAASSANIVPFRPTPAHAPPPPQNAPSLSSVEHHAFRELAQELTARLLNAREETRDEPPGVGAGFGRDAKAVTPGEAATEAATPAVPMAQNAADVSPLTPSMAADASAAEASAARQALLDSMPAGIVVYSDDSLLYANRYFFELSGYHSLDALTAAGGLNSLFAASEVGALADGGAHLLSIMMQSGDKLPAETRLFTVPWNGATASALTMTRGDLAGRERAAHVALHAAETEIRELKMNADRAARRETQKATAAKADFLAKVSHEIRTPLNSMIGFAEVIMAERFGAIGNERYREYLKDIHAAGTHLISLLNDLLDLSKIETGQLDLTFGHVDLNDLTGQCVGVMQPQANRARIIIRRALTPGLPQVVADARSLRQIVLNLLTNAIKLTGPGGQIIISTASADGGEVVLRVRDTGIGMKERDIEAVLDPFARDVASAGWDSGTAGLGLPLTKALAEANRARFSIKSAPNVGTLVEVAFSPSRAAAE